MPPTQQNRLDSCSGNNLPTTSHFQSLNFLKKLAHRRAFPPPAPAQLPTLLSVDGLPFARSEDFVEEISDSSSLSHISAVSSLRTHRKSGYLSTVSVQERANQWTMSIYNSQPRGDFELNQSRISEWRADQLHHGSV